MTVFRAYLKALSTLLKQVDCCLIVVIPEDNLGRAQAYVDTIDAIIASALYHTDWNFTNLHP